MTPVLDTDAWTASLRMQDAYTHSERWERHPSNAQGLDVKDVA